jgi:ABC-type uncharacterized transport system fused permease/ATPase subunit
VLVNYLQLIRAQKRLTWFTVGFGQAAVVFSVHRGRAAVFQRRHPSSAKLMQIASAFGPRAGCAVVVRGQLRPPGELGAPPPTG